jgi:hypothetical protein
LPPKTGLLSRPTVEEVYRYRAYVDQQMMAFLEGLCGDTLDTWFPIVELWLHHEQQHQELLLTDLKYNFACNPLRPAYVTADSAAPERVVNALQWVSFPEGVYWIGHDGQDLPLIMSPSASELCRAVPVGITASHQWGIFGLYGRRWYERPELWLSMGWDTVQREDGRLRCIGNGAMGRGG